MNNDRTMLRMSEYSLAAGLAAAGLFAGMAGMRGGAHYQNELPTFCGALGRKERRTAEPSAKKARKAQASARKRSREK